VQVDESHVQLWKVLHRQRRHRALDRVGALVERGSVIIVCVVLKRYVFDGYVVEVLDAYPRDRAVDYPEAGNMPVNELEVGLTCQLCVGARALAAAGQEKHGKKAHGKNACACQSCIG